MVTTATTMVDMVDMAAMVTGMGVITMAIMTMAMGTGMVMDTEDTIIMVTAMVTAMDMEDTMGITEFKSSRFEDRNTRPAYARHQSSFIYYLHISYINNLYIYIIYSLLVVKFQSCS